MKNNGVGEMVKFASQLEADVLEDLRRFAKETDRSLSRVLTEAVRQYLQRAQVRPAFRDATEEVLAEHEELLRRLAK
jgi:predicted transcriptional regulator